VPPGGHHVRDRDDSRYTDQGERRLGMSGSESRRRLCAPHLVDAEDGTDGLNQSV
jgi:hypothetical protein